APQFHPADSARRHESCPDQSLTILESLDQKPAAKCPNIDLLRVESDSCDSLPVIVLNYQFMFGYERCMYCSSAKTKPRCSVCKPCLAPLRSAPSSGRLNSNRANSAVLVSSHWTFKFSISGRTPLLTSCFSAAVNTKSSSVKRHNWFKPCWVFSCASAVPKLKRSIQVVEKRW